MKIKVFEAVLVGVSAMLQNPMTDAVLEELMSGVRKQVNKDRTQEDIAKEKVVVRDGYLGVPVEWLNASLVEAGRKVKNGKSLLSTKESSLVPSILSIREEFLPFENIENNGSFGWLTTFKEAGYPADVTDVPWVPDRRRGQLNNGGKKVAVAIVRPKFAAGWKITATLEIDVDECGEDTVKKLVDVAARTIGLGDFRPMCRGTFGRSMVASWREIKTTDKAKSATA